MSTYTYKTEYNLEGPFGDIETKTLYVKHYNGCDVVSYYDENGEYLFSVSDTVDNNMFDAIERLYYPLTKYSQLKEGIYLVDANERQKLKI